MAARRRWAAAACATGALGLVAWLLAALAAQQAGYWRPGEVVWFASWGLLAGLAALAPWLHSRAPRLAGWLPYAAAALFLGLAVPGVFSIGPIMLLAGLLDLAAGWLLAPAPRRVALTLALAAALTAGLLGGALAR